MTAVRIQPYISDNTYKQLKKESHLPGRTISAIIEAALQEYFDDAKDFPLVLRRLDRIQRAIERVERDQQMLTEAFAVFVQIWFAHTPKIDNDSRNAAQRQAMDRYNQFIDFVANKITSGHRFIDDMAQFNLSEDLDEAVDASKKEEMQS